MDYKIELQKNNEDLNNIIDKAKALPDADGSGGGGLGFDSKAGGVPGNGIKAISVLDFSTITFASSAEHGEI